MAIRIVSKRDGFWRCGKQHKAEPVIWPEESFNPEELQRLMADKTLDVTIVPDPEIEDAGTPENPAPNPNPEGTPFATDEKGKGLTIAEMSVAQLKDLAKYMGMEPFKNNTSKVKMLAAIEAYANANNFVANEKGELFLGDDKSNTSEDNSNQPPSEPDSPADSGADDEGAEGANKTEDSGEPPTE